MQSTFDHERLGVFRLAMDYVAFSYRIAKPLRVALAGLLLLAPLALGGCNRSARSVQQAGGYVLVYGLESPAPDEMEGLVRALEERLRQGGIRDASARIKSDDEVEISLAGADAETLSRAKQLIGTTGKLEFRVLAKPGEDDELIALAAEASEDEGGSDGPEDSGDAPDGSGNEQSPANGPSFEQAEILGDEYGSVRGRWVRYDPGAVELGNDVVTRDTDAGTPQVLVVLDDWDLTGAYLKMVRESVDQAGNPCLTGTFTNQGAQRMRALSSANLPQPSGETRFLGMILDNQLISAPRIQSEIGASFQLTGQFTESEVDLLVAVLKAGRLPVPLKREPLSETQVAPKK